MRARLRWATEARIGVWEPLSFAVKAALYAAAGAGEIGRASRIAALLAHAAHALLVGAVAEALVAARAAARGGGAAGRAPSSAQAAAAAASAARVGGAAAALLFALHPLSVEVVMWPSSTPYTMAGLLYTAGVLVYLRAAYCRGGVLSPAKDAQGVVHKGGSDAMVVQEAAAAGTACSSGFSVGPQPLSGRASAAIAACFVAAALSKSIAVTLPLALVCLDVALLPPLVARRMSVGALMHYAARRLWAQGPLLVAMAGLIGGAAAANTGARGESTVQHDMVELDGGERLLRAALMPWSYAGRFVWPAELLCHYAIPQGYLRVRPRNILSALY